MTVSSLSSIQHIVSAPAKSEKVTPTTTRPSSETPAASTTAKVSAVKSSSPVSGSNVSVLAPQSVTQTVTDPLGGTSTVTYTTPNTDY